MHGTDRATGAKPYAQYKCTLAQALHHRCWCFSL